MPVIHSRFNENFSICCKLLGNRYVYMDKLTEQAFHTCSIPGAGAGTIAATPAISSLSSVGSFITDIDAGLAISSDEDKECILPPDAAWTDSSGDADVDTLALLTTLPPPPVMVDERDRVWVRTAGGGKFCRRRVSSLRDGGNRGITPGAGEYKLTYYFPGLLLRIKTFHHRKNGIFWDVTLCGSCKNRRFGGT
jgi:hypothetical protein